MGSSKILKGGYLSNSTNLLVLSISNDRNNLPSYVTKTTPISSVFHIYWRIF